MLLEAELCGHGPSGRNGGFCETLWSHIPSLVERFGHERALEVCHASSESVGQIGAWCEDQGVDAWFTRAGFLMASTAAAHDAVLDEILAAAPRDKVVALDDAELRARCDSPRFRRGIYVPDDATVQPARLALGLRDRVMARRARVFEHSRVRALRVGGDVVAETAARERPRRLRRAGRQRRHARLPRRCAGASRSPRRTSCSPSRCRTWSRS